VPPIRAVADPGIEAAPRIGKADVSALARGLFRASEGVSIRVEYSKDSGRPQAQ
jgi:hypothetical protein